METIKNIPLRLRMAGIAAAIILIVLFLQGWGEGQSSKESENSTYEITDERYSAGWYSAGIEANVKTKETIKTLLNQVMKEERIEQDGKVAGAQIRVYRGDTLVANARIAYDKKELQKTGLDQIKKWEIILY